jgi:hypothetical protein
MAALGLGIACMVGALMVTDLRDRHALSSRGLRTEAVVLRIERHRAAYPVFAFSTAEGLAAERRGRAPTYTPQLAPGQRVTVVYDPADPDLVQDAAGFDAEPAWRPWQWAPFLLLGLALVLLALRWPGRLRRA